MLEVRSQALTSLGVGSGCRGAQRKKRATKEACKGLSSRCTALDKSFTADYRKRKVLCCTFPADLFSEQKVRLGY